MEAAAAVEADCWLAQPLGGDARRAARDAAEAAARERRRLQEARRRAPQRGLPVALRKTAGARGAPQAQRT